MSIIEEVLFEEYERSLRICEALNEEISKLPYGSLQKKKINGREYWYLQYRAGKVVKSKYIKTHELEEYKIMLKRREESIAALKEQKKSQNQIERALGKEYIREHSKK